MSGTRAGQDLELFSADGCPTLGARDRGREGPAATRVAVNRGWTTRRPRPAVTPGSERRKNGHKLAPGLGKYVAVARRAFGVTHAFDDSILDERAKPRREHIAGDAQVGREIVEAVQPEKDVAQDERRPPVADLLEGASERAVHIGETGLAHAYQA